MQREKSQDRSSVIKMVLEIPAGLVERVDAYSHLTQAVLSRVCRGVTEWLETLGIPGRLSLELRSLDSSGESPDRWLRLSVGGQSCRYSPAMLQRAFSRACDAPNEVPADLDYIHRWLQERVSGRGQVAAHADRHAFAEFLVLACLEIIQAQPAILFGLEHAAAYAILLRTPRQTSASPGKRCSIRPSCNLFYRMCSA
jgi:hypothetical protein